MPALQQYLPQPIDEILKLEPEEIAGYLLEFLNNCDDRPGSQDVHSYFNLHNLLNGFHRQLGQPEDNPFSQAVTEAWKWLEREGFIAEKPSGWIFVTRRGKALKTRSELDEMRRASILPRKMLHPAIDLKVWPPFLHGDYDTAVFCAFKEVEIAVRNAAKLSATDIGQDLMRKAFRESIGPLTNKSLPPSEQQALANLFAGSMGYYRNPFGHRQVALNDPAEAAEMIMLASHLMRLVAMSAPPAGP